MTDETDGKGMEEAKGVSRRNFIKGVISSGVAASSANYLFRATSVFARAAGDPGERLITLNVNGQQRRVDVMKQETLAMTLRYKLGLTGTKTRLRPRRMRRLHRADRRCSALLLLGAHAHGARQEDRDDRRPGQRRWHAASGAAGRHRRTGLPVRVLHVGLHHGDGRIPENESQSHPRGTGARHFRQPVPLPGLRQDPHRDDARRGELEEGEPCLAQSGSRINRSSDPQYKLIGKNYTTPISRESDRQVEIRRGLSRRRHALLQAAAEPRAACPRARIDRQRGPGDARREGHPHRGRSSRPGRQHHRSTAP